MQTKFGEEQWLIHLLLIGEIILVLFDYTYDKYDTTFCSALHSAARGDLVEPRTTRQPGILYGWSGRLEQSTTGHSFGTYMVNFQKHADTSFLRFLLYRLFPEYEQRTLYGLLVVTLAV